MCTAVSQPTYPIVLPLWAFGIFLTMSQAPWSQVCMLLLLQITLTSALRELGRRRWLEIDWLINRPQRLRRVAQNY